MYQRRLKNIVSAKVHYYISLQKMMKLNFQKCYFKSISSEKNIIMEKMTTMQ